MFDIDYKLERISGFSIDSFEIEGNGYRYLSNLLKTDAIPTELALPSDFRFREDIIYLRRGEKGKGKVWRGMINEQ